MPSVVRLNEIAATLTSEFPWAAEAIDGILAEVIARKRAGSSVLGMMPVLLVRATRVRQDAIESAAVGSA